MVLQIFPDTTRSHDRLDPDFLQMIRITNAGQQPAESLDVPVRECSERGRAQVTPVTPGGVLENKVAIHA